MERIARLTTKRRESEELEGLRGERKRERVSEPSARNVSKSVLWRPPSPSLLSPPPLLSLRPHSLFLFLYLHMCVWQTLQRFCPCLTVIINLRKLFKSKAARALQKFLKMKKNKNKTHIGPEATGDDGEDDKKGEK